MKGLSEFPISLLFFIRIFFVIFIKTYPPFILEDYRKGKLTPIFLTLKSKSMISKFTTKYSFVFSILCFLLLGNILNAQSITITSPASVAGEYPVKPAVYGPLINGPIAGLIELADDGNDNGIGITDACEPLLNDMTGKIAMIDRGGCLFENKTIHAQDQGAILVIVCNGEGQGDETVSMAGVGAGIVNIPSVMMSYNNCEILKTEIENGIMATANPFAPGESCPTANNISEGSHFVPELVKGGSINPDATSAYWYSYTPEVDGEVNLSACGGGVDTRLFVSTSECMLLDMPILLENDNTCDLGNGVLNASELNFSVTAGTEYKIFWDDRWDSNGFEFTLNNSSVSTEDIEFNNSISIYPNPASGITNIEYNFDESNDLKIQLMNNLGQQISADLLNSTQNGVHQMNLENLASGVYFIHITNGEASMIEKLFVD